MKNTSISFIGNNAIDVTGSCTIIKHNNIRIALDCGLIQTNNILADYKANKEQEKKIKPRDLQYIIISHIHADHIGMLPIIYALGCQAHVYVPNGSKDMMKVMLEDSVKIMEQDAIKLEHKHGIKCPSLAKMNDVDRVMQRVNEVPFHQDHVSPNWIHEDVCFDYYPAGHIVNSAQIYLQIKDGYQIKRIGYTGDICNENKSVSVDPLYPLPYVDVLIGECTYSRKERCYSVKKDRWYDEQIIMNAIKQYNKILIPVFSLQRLEDMLSCLSKLDIGNTKVYVDAPLGQKIYKEWPDDLNFENKLNLTWVTLWEDSEALQTRDEHCIILSTSGMLSAGRAVAHLKTLLPNPNNAILFCGYSGDNTLATQIKLSSKQIRVDLEMIDNKAQIYCLNTFSSHSNHDQLMNYYQSLDYNKLYLVHSAFESKVAFANELEEKLHKNGKAAKVIATNADTKVYL